MKSRVGHLVTTSVVAGLMLLVLGGCARDPQKRKRNYLQAGTTYMKKGKYPEAAIEFRKVLSLDPHFPEAYYRLSQADVALGEWKEAYSALQQTVELEPGRLDAHLDLGRIYLAAKQYDKAESEASLVLERDPHNTTGYQLMAASLVGLQDGEGAAAAFVKLAELMPKDASARVDLALVEASLNRYPDAERHLREAVQVDPHFVQAYSNLANFYRLRGQLPQAEQVFREGVERNPDATDLHLALAQFLYAQQNAEGAKTVLQKLSQQHAKSPEVALALGDFYSQRKEFDAALRQYRLALQLDPKGLEVKLRLVDVLLAVNRVSDAAALNHEVLRQKPKDTAARIADARILLAQGKIDEAVVELRQQVMQSPDSAQAHYFLGLAHWQNGQLDLAKSELQEALRVAPKLEQALHSLSELNLALNEYRVAEEYARRSVAAEPGNASEHMLLGTVYLREELPAKAREEFLLAQKLAPTDPAVHVNLALACAKGPDYAEAEREFDKALQLNPRFNQALGMLADFLVRRNERAEAVSRVQQYLASYPDDANAHVILGSLDFGARLYDAARAEFERAIQLDPHLVTAYLKLGELSQQSGEIDNAIQRYEAALRLEPNLVPLITLIGNLYLDKADLASARKYYERALAINPGFAVAAGNLALVYIKQGDNLDVALGLAQRAKQLSPDLDSITDTLAWVEYAKGSYASALPLLQECIQKAPDSPVYHYHLGMVLLAAGEEGKGRAQLEAALRLKLKGEDAAKARQKLARAN